MVIERGIHHDLLLGGMGMATAVGKGLRGVFQMEHRKIGPIANGRGNHFILQTKAMDRRSSHPMDDLW